MKLSKIALLIACVAAPAGLIVVSNGSNAQAADLTVAVPIGSASQYSVLAASTVTNTGLTTLARSLGLSPGTAITGFPPGVVSSQGQINVANASAQQAQADLGSGFNNAAGRALNGTTPADLAGQNLKSGVYAADGKGALSLNGTLVLDGNGNTDSVFIFQTDSTLTTGSGSSVVLIGGAQACRVYWVVGSSATLGTGTSFVGTIMAQASITVTTGASVRGRALARTGAVTLDSNVFTPASCQPPKTATATTIASGVVPATTSPRTTTTTIPRTTTTIPRTTTTTAVREMPVTGSTETPQLLVATLLVASGIAAALVARRRRLLG